MRWRPYRAQTREHLFKYCPHWKGQQKILWVEVRRDTRRGKERFKIRDLFADERCSQSILDFLPPPTWGGWSQPRLMKTYRVRCQSDRRGRDGERRAETEELGAGDGDQLLFLPTPSFMASAEEE